MLPECSIVIVSWNVRDLLRACLRSLPAASDGRPTEVIVVDNGSSDDTMRMLRTEFPAVQRLAQPRNLGFARGNNLGLAAARGRYVLLLNPDTEMRPHALPALIGYLDRHPCAGLAGPRLLNSDGSPQSSRRRFPSLATLLVESTPLQPLWPRAALLARYYVLDQDDDSEQAVDWVTGAAMLVRPRSLAAVGGFDPGYFMYSEELDLCRRLRRAGWRTGYVPAAVVVHHGGRSSEQDVPTRHIYFQRSKLRYVARWHGRSAAAALRLWLIGLYAWQGGLEAGKWLVGHRRPLRRERLALIGRVLASLWRAAGR